MRKLKWIGLLAAAAVVAMTAGCHHNETPNGNVMLHGEDFPAQDEPRSVWEIRSAQAASGARQDATLYAVHFDSGGLNSLGRQKLDLMLADEDAAEPVVVYLDVASGSEAEKDRQSVMSYLKDRGLQNSQIALKDGPNPHAGHSAAEAVNSLQMLEAGPAPQSGTPGPSIPVNQNATSPGNPQPTYIGH